MGHKHRDLEDFYMVCDLDLKEQSLQMLETAEERDELLLPLANSTINMGEPVTEPINSRMKCDEKSENIKGVLVTHKVSVKKKIDYIRNYLTYFEHWENLEISHFMVKEEKLYIFSVEVSCMQKKYLKEFTVSWAADFLTSLPWPPDYSLISSKTPSYLT